MKGITLFLFVAILGAVTFSAAAQLRSTLSVEGSIVEGIGTQSLRDGGDYIAFHLSGIAQFDDSLRNTEMCRLARESFEATNIDLTNFLQSALPDNCRVQMSPNKKILTFHLAPAVLAIEGMASLSIHPPRSLAKSGSTVEPQVKSFFALPGRRAAFELTTPQDEVQVDDTIDVQFYNFSSMQHVVLVRGEGCDRPEANSNVTVSPRSGKGSLRVSRGGELFGVCYQPTGQNSPTFIRAKGKFAVAGPYDMTVTSQEGRDVSLRIEGFRLSTADTISYVPQGQDCQNLTQDAILQLSIALRSSTLADAQFKFERSGRFQVCYLHGSRFVAVGTPISVLLDGGAYDELHVTSEHPRALARDTVVSRLWVESGSLQLLSGGLNVSVHHFLWEGGTISGRGSIYCRHGGLWHNISAQGQEITTAIHNYGTMVFRADNTVFRNGGHIHNHAGATLIVEFDEPQSALTGDARSQFNSAILNAQGATLIVRSVRGGKAHLISQVQWENRGLLELSSGIRVDFRQLRVEKDAVTVVHESAQLNCEGSPLVSGLFVIKNKGGIAFATGPVLLRDLAITGEEATNMLLHVGQISLHNVTVSGSTYVFAHSRSGTGRLALSGLNTIGKNATLVLRNIGLSASQLSYLTISGRFVCDVSSLRIGDNIILSANLHAVLFGTGVKDEDAAKLMPQNLPQNSSFHVPPDATVILLDVGNHSTESKAGPHICSHHIVVPVHVVLRGETKLWGCASLPYGGEHSGVIFGASYDIIDATTQYASCKTVLARRDDAHTSDSRFGLPADACIPVFPQNQPSGLSYGGGHLVRRTEVDSRPVVDVDRMRVWHLGRFIGDSAVTILTRTGLLVETDGALSLTHGGHVIGPQLTVRGLLEASAHAPLLITGEVAMEGKLQVRTAQNQCIYPLSVSDRLQFSRTSSVQCSAPLNLSWGESAAVVKGATIEGDPGELIGCSLPHFGVTDVRHKGYWGLQVADNEKTPSTKRLLLSVFCGVVVTVGFGCFFVARIGAPTFMRELLNPSPFPLHLSWPEFSAFSANYIAVGVFILEAALLTAPAFHPLLQLPSSLSGLSQMSAFLLGLFPGTIALRRLIAFEIICIAIWVLAWIPLAGERVSNHLERLLRDRRGAKEMYAVQVLFQFHTFATFVALALFVPVVSTLLDPLACVTVLSDVHECSHLRPYTLWSSLALIVFLTFAPLSGTATRTPFSHPPYMRELDVRSKRTTTHVHCLLLFLTVVFWKVFGRQPTLALITSLIMFAAIVGLNLVSNPCVYTNINTLRRILYLFTFAALLAALVQVARYGPSPSFICSTVEPVYVAMLSIGWIVSTILLVVYLRRSGSEAQEYLRLVDPETAISLQALTDQWDLIEHHRLSMYNSANSRERDSFAVTMAQLRIEYLKRLHAFRHQKEPMLITYYLGRGAHQSLLPDINPSPASEEESQIQENEMALKCVPATPEDIELLTPEQMASFTEGPMLGRGTYGSVYMGMLSIGKLVAVKVVQISRKQKAESLSAIKKEVDVLRALGHPNIIRYYGCHATRKQIYIFMELATSGSLTQLVRKFGQLSESVMQLYTRQILGGLEYLHKKHTVHRDIKGENILVDGFGNAKLADFGCSKALADVANKSQQGCISLVGSPYWMAPEVIRNEAYGTKADVWSLGCTVVEMLNGGHPPWHEKFDNVYSAMFFIGNTTDLPSNIPSTVSDSCRDFLSQCFERDVAKRASVTELLSHPWVTAADAQTPHSSNESPLERKWSDMFDNTSEATSGPSTLSRQPTSSFGTGSPGAETQ